MMRGATDKRAAAAPAERSLAGTAYNQLKASIFEFELLPGDRFSESEIAERLAMSRTPVREALYRLEHEGHLSVHFRNGWSVRPFDFAQASSADCITKMRSPKLFVRSAEMA